MSQTALIPQLSDSNCSQVFSFSQKLKLSFLDIYLCETQSQLSFFNTFALLSIPTSLWITLLEGGWSWKKSRPRFVSRVSMLWVWWSRPPCSRQRTDCETNVHSAMEHSEVCVYLHAHTPIGHGCVRRMATCHSLGRDGSGHLGLWD